jgi:hypothetical protein
MIRQTSTGMEQRCPKCVRNGESPEDCWWPLTPEFFAVKHPGKTRLVHYNENCIACSKGVTLRQEVA